MAIFLVFKLSIKQIFKYNYSGAQTNDIDIILRNFTYIYVQTDRPFFKAKNIFEIILLLITLRNILRYRYVFIEQIVLY